LGAAAGLAALVSATLAGRWPATHRGPVRGPHRGGTQTPPRPYGVTVRSGGWIRRPPRC